MRVPIAFSALVVCASLLYAQPKIEIVGGKKFDFGEIHRGKKVDRTVVIKNTGNQVLELGRVDVSCGCTGTVASTTSIAPGKTGEVLITFNSANFQGKIHKSVTINSNAPDSPTVVEFEGDVVQEITITQQFFFRDAEVGRVSVATVTLTNNSKTPILLTGYDTELTGLKLMLPKNPIQPGKSIDVVAELKAQTATNFLNDGVSIKTSSKNEPDVFVRVYGAVKEFKFQ
ncbi:MAG: DUF1573 domain-containing protein [Ignavibacteriae bacterium]|nr:DUF1573 domain-containing protein [Ignavibacteriota bacterium]